MKPIFTILSLFFFVITSIAQPVQAPVLGRWTDNAITPTSWLNGRYNEVWGLKHNGSEYAVLGSTEGVHFVGINQGTNTTELGRIIGKATGPSLVHRDFKHYKNYLYAVADEGPSSLQIIDFNNLPNGVQKVYDNDEFVIRAHNLYIDTLNAKLYLCGGTDATSSFSVKILDISNPTSPTLVGSYPNADLSIPYTHDLYVQNDTAYLNNGNSGFRVVDFSDPAAPVLLGTMTNYVDQGYNHSGWMAPGNKYYYLADETHGKDMKVLNVCELDDLATSQTIPTGIPTPTRIVHNILTRCNMMYASYYYDGFIAYDISDPANPVKVSYYDTFDGPDAASYQGAWGVFPLPSGRVLVSDMQSGLWVFEGPTLNCSPTLTKTCADGTSSTNDFAVGLRQIKVYPQPATDQLTLEFEAPSASPKAKVSLYSINGKLMQTQEFSSVSAGTQKWNLPINQDLNGMFLLRIEGDSYQLMEKVIFQ